MCRVPSQSWVLNHPKLAIEVYFCACYRRKPKSEKLATNADNTLTELKGSLADKMDTATLEKAQKLTKAKDEIEATAGHEKEEVYEYKDERNWKDWGTWGAWPEGMTAGKRKLRWSEEEVNVISTSD